jgi:hypothetical protein
VSVLGIPSNDQTESIISYDGCDHPESRVNDRCLEALLPAFIMSVLGIPSNDQTESIISYDACDHPESRVNNRCLKA